MTESFEDAIKALRHIARGNGSVLRIADRIVAAHERETKVEGVCEPITGELRGAMRQWGWVESDGSITFATSSMPPSIDAEQSLAISGSDFDRLCDAIDSIHAQLERENAALKAELDRVLGDDERDGWIELPKDANGKPIHVGDTVEYVDDTLAPRNVTSINLAGDGWWVYINGLGRRPDRYRHVTPDTWERIIDDALDGYHDTDFDNLVARCKALAGDAE